MYIYVRLRHRGYLLIVLLFNRKCIIINNCIIISYTYINYNIIIQVGKSMMFLNQLFKT